MLFLFLVDELYLEFKVLIFFLFIVKMAFVFSLFVRWREAGGGGEELV